VEASIVLFFFVLLLGITSRLLVVSVLLLGIEIPEKVVLRVARGAHLSREEMNQKRYTKKGKADGNSSRTVRACWFSRNGVFVCPGWNADFFFFGGFG